jgi:hypothetical protein
MPEYTNIPTMLDDIVSYVTRTGADILCDDEPRQRTYGFRSTDEAEIRWSITAHDASVGPVPTDPRQALMHRAFLTADGRRQLAVAMSSAGHRQAETIVSSAPEQPVRDPPAEPRAQVRTLFDRLLDDDLLPP